MAEDSKAKRQLSPENLNDQAWQRHLARFQSMQQGVIHPVSAQPYPLDSPKKGGFSWKMLSLGGIALLTFGIFATYLAGQADSSQDLRPMPVISAAPSGGTGNWMFIIAATISRALDVGGQAVFVKRAVDHVGQSPIFDRISYFEGPSFWTSRLKERNFQYVDPASYSPNSLHLSGQFFSAKYFDHHRKEILETFAPSPELKADLEAKYSEILKKETIAVHIRRGDYKTFSFQGERAMCDLAEETNYYDKAIAHFLKSMKEPHFVIFSDDPAYVQRMPVLQKLQAESPGQITFISNSKAHEDLYLMSMCKHQVMANSTFSWWAAYLRKHPNAQVIYPMNAFWGPGVTKIAKSWWLASQFWGTKLVPEGFHPNGVCSRGPDYFPMEGWIKLDSEQKGVPV